MSPAHVLEPTYQAIKQRLMTGRWPPGYHLDTARLADDLGVSKSPVRDSLNHLAGERMVAFEAGMGFYVPRLDETQLKDLLDLNLNLLLIVLQSEAVIQLEPLLDDYSDEASRCFLRLARMSANGEIIAAIAGINERLSVIRRLESLVLPEANITLKKLDRALAVRSGQSIIAKILLDYHDERKSYAAKFIRILTMGLNPE